MSGDVIASPAPRPRARRRGFQPRMVAEQLTLLMRVPAGRAQSK